jgi:hypothetical protein
MLRRVSAGGQPAFPPGVVVQVKALACELPHRRGLPVSRFTIPEIQREVIQQGIVATISGTTVWRWLSQDAISTAETGGTPSLKLLPHRNLSLYRSNER